MIRFHPATEEEEVAYVSLFSYFSSRGRFGVVSNNSRSIKDVYLLPLSAKESIPPILQPLEGPGVTMLESSHKSRQTHSFVSFVFFQGLFSNVIAFI